MLDYKLATMKLLKSFNDDSIPDDYTLAMLKARRMSVAEQMMGKLGCGVNIEPPFFCGWGCNIFIGEGVYINRESVPLLINLEVKFLISSRVSIYDNAAVVIGDRVLIGPGVCICTGTHEVEARARQESKNGSFAQPIRIESDCWIGARVTILPGVKIGRGSTIAAGAVVIKDVEEGCVAGGVPAKVIKRLKGAINGLSNGAVNGL